MDEIQGALFEKHVQEPLLERRSHNLAHCSPSALNLYKNRGAPSCSNSYHCRGLTSDRAHFGSIFQISCSIIYYKYASKGYRYFLAYRLPWWSCPKSQPRYEKDTHLIWRV